MQNSTSSKIFLKTQTSRLLSVLAAALAFSFSTESIAQTGMLEEVIVTAQKREESVQDVGIAITAFTGEQLKAFGFIKHVQSISTPLLLLISTFVFIPTSKWQEIHR